MRHHYFETKKKRFVDVWFFLYRFFFFRLHSIIIVCNSLQLDTADEEEEEGEKLIHFSYSELENGCIAWNWCWYEK